MVNLFGKILFLLSVIATSINTPINQDKELQIDNKKIATYGVHKEQIYDIAVPHKGNFVVTTSGDDTVKIWNTETGTLLKQLDIFKQNTLAVDLTADDKLCAIASWNKTITIWNTADWSLIKTLPTTELPAKISFSPSGEQLIVLNRNDGHASIFNTRSGERENLQISGWISAVSFSPDGQLFACASSINSSHLIYILDAKTFTIKSTLKGHTKRIWDLEFSSKGDFLISCGDETIRKWNPKTGQEMSWHITKYPITKVTISSDDNNVFAMSDKLEDNGRGSQTYICLLDNKLADEQGRRIFEQITAIASLNDSKTYLLGTIEGLVFKIQI
jgi:WD40 repeat protein